MIGYEEVPEDRLVIVTVDGKVTKAELRRAFDRFEAFVAANKPVRILQIVRSLSGIEPAALWEDVT
ncbi:MAG TPA: STAS/SEC14 domain-containing protein, partial [Afifellaceae bacterium]|nr:STAS/SEC14 domain-containing protein [Afifellaceae bacterium]